MVLAMTAQRSARFDWLAAVAAGGLTGALFGIWPTIAFLITLAFVVPALASGHRAAAIGGFFLGLSALWLAIVAIADARCAAFDIRPGQECLGPDLTGWIVVAAAVFVAGLIASASLVRKGRS
jgi:drug/metabolite transporter superfamily protein YnfA